MTRGWLTQICFAPGMVGGSLFARLVKDHDLGFTPATVSWSEGGRGGKRFSEEALARLAATRDVDWARVHGEDGEEFSLTGIAGHPVRQLLWRSDRAGSEDLVPAVVELPGFNAAYCGDADDVYWQSETSIEVYESAGRPHDALPTREGGFFPGEDEEIDVSANPGRRTPYDGILLWAASRMWFGARAFEHLDRERLLALPVGEVAETAHGRVVVVDLYPLDWIDSRLEEVRDRQRAFRDWMGFDALEQRSGEVAAAEADPTFEIESGTFEHGGVRRLTEWLDASGVRAVPRSRARRSRTVELSEDGRALWQAENVLSA